MRVTINTIVFLLCSFVSYSQAGGVYHGYKVNTGKDGKRISEGMYKNGLRIGEWIYYSSNGIDTGYTTRSIGHGQYYCKVYSANPNFVLREGVVENFRQGDEIKSWPIGKWTSYYMKDGQRHVLTHYNFRDGKQHGEYIHFDVALNARVEGQYKDSLKAGEWTYFDIATGKPYQKEHYVNGKFQGAYEYYNRNTSKLQIQGTHEKGMKNGTWSYFDSTTGTCVKKENYLAGTLHGDLLSYDSQGHPLESGQYKNGVKTGTWKYYKQGTEQFTTRNFDEVAAGFSMVGSVEWDDTAYYQKNLNPGAEKATAWYFRPPVEKIDETHYRVAYYRMNGIPHMLLTVLPGKMDDRYSLEIGQAINDGYAIFYDSLGNKESEGVLTNNKQTGEWIYYFPGSNRISYKSTHLGGKLFYNKAYRKFPNVQVSEGAFEKVMRNGKETMKLEGKWVSFYQNGDTLEVSHFNKEGKLQGRFVAYDSATRHIMVEGSYADSLKDGVWSRYNSLTGKLLNKLTLSRGKQQGPFAVYDSLSGRVTLEGSWADTMATGKWTRYNPATGQLVKVQNFSNDKLHGDLITYDTNGHVLDSVFYYEDELSGLCKYYFEDSRHVLFKLSNYKNGKLHGAYLLHDSATGNIIASGNFSDDEMTGEWVNYDGQTNKLIRSRNFSDGKLHGKSVIYGLDGNVVEIENYKRGKRSGEYKLYYPGTTRINIDANFKSDYGDFITYDSATGKKLVEGKVSEEGRAGKWTNYYPGGDKVWYTHHYNNNVPHGEMREYAEDGHLVALSEFKDGNKTTMMINHDNSEKKWIEYKYSKDTLVGLFTFYPSGKTKCKQYLNEKRELIEICYDEEGKEMSFSPITANPQFRGDVMTYIGNNLKYPEEAKDKRLEGKTIVSFIVNKNGTLSDIYVQKGFDPRCDEEALRLVSSMPLWKPAEIDGKPFSMQQTLPIVFWLPDEKPDRD